jgi:hypothetical protein
MVAFAYQVADAILIRSVAMLHNQQGNSPLSSLAVTLEWLLAALGAVACIALPVAILSSPGNLPGEITLWPMPGLLFLEIALLGLAALAGIAGFSPQALRGPTAAWFACGALAAIGVVGWIGVSVVFFALVPAMLFGLAAALAVRRLGKGWRAGLSTLVFGAGMSAVLLFMLTSLSLR